MYSTIPAPDTSVGKEEAAAAAAVCVIMTGADAVPVAVLLVVANGVTIGVII